ncbi:MAG: DUF6485 family protein [Candidatus Cloacimonetes bacterium]|nr:DUF6485 family protein [Candidatus Cloacimonadota bacterium]
MSCENQKKNQKHCNCTYPCSRKGICCECIAYHRANKELPACYFPDDIEKTYIRSISNFIKLHNEGKI